VRQFHPWSKDVVRLARHPDFIAIWTPKEKLAHMSATFQPDSLQIFIQSFQGCGSLHLQIQLVLTLLGGLDAEMIEVYKFTLLPGSFADGVFSLGAYRQMFRHAAL
jgi:hypothetical protein